ncbi:MAG: sulfurtransferase [Cyanobacteria bacterium J06623_4]
MENSRYLVDVPWLQDHLEDPQVVVIDTRFALSVPDAGRQAYLAGHIPGAYYLDLDRDLSSPVARHGGRHPLPDWEKFASKLSQLGIYSQPPGPTQVIIYDDSRFAFAARLWWMLRYLGHEQVAILDGGIQAWKSAGLPLSESLPAERPGDFRPSFQSGWLVDIETVRQQASAPNGTVIDSRSPERWRGEVEPIDPIAGSVPGSQNAFWKDVSTEEGKLKSPEALADYWKHHPITADTIVYCGSGVTACVNIFSLVAAGYPMCRLYPGGWSDWCSYSTAGKN